MKLHLLWGDLDFHWLQPAGGVMWNFQAGIPVTKPWEVPRLLLPEGHAAEEFLPVDCLPINTGCDGPVLSDFARRVLDDLLTPAGELLPVDVLGRRYWWFNCLAETCALDPEKTDAEWGSIETEGEAFRWIMAPRRLAFRPERVAAAPAVFRVPELPHGVLFADQRLKRAISLHRLTGFRMDLIWSRESGGVRNPAGFDFSGAWAARRGGTIERKRASALAVLQRRGMA